MKLAALILLTITLSSCTTKLTDYSATEPAFALEDYFDGQVTAWGIIEDYKSKVTRRFCVDITGQWQGNNGQLHEVFYYDDGETDQRTWQLTHLGNGEYSGTAGDVVGTAEGQIRGSVFHWRYHLMLEVKGKPRKLFLDDWIYQLDENRLFNRTKISKFGVDVAELSIFFDKQLPLSQCQEQTLIPG
ncbi:DUF3833 domain-containing protein [Reinekea thalattae]|uniref:DUF3833 domain-containing protein n=1 Tax=Reinekea thalattae TaxID=2593301 RepID=A0A5C8ZCL0_9GAMM|nr:DUF3833 domain-containing protein [Reinekea thalattae]TXR54878.1 DUF3833 domain-containing protein [Reinekea thalattae]